jgi:hypothetical protein
MALLLVAGCRGHQLTEHEKVFQRVCGNHSCPPPGVTRPTVDLVVDGRTHRAPEALAAGRSHAVQVTVHLERGSALTSYWVSETRRGDCCPVTPAGPQDGHVLLHGGALRDGQVLVLTWTASIRGDRELVLTYDSKAPQDKYERDGPGGIPLGSFEVS